MPRGMVRDSHAQEKGSTAILPSKRKRGKEKGKREEKFAPPN